jgi:hypothetical protein
MCEDVEKVKKGIAVLAELLDKAIPLLERLVKSAGLQ